ncbi:hypothetical protein HERIO_220 [Hepatospora eriocheir]|uniref:Uncharacterized protein n=1 Tax=Hepatospora eriocheir TaxID=1081669 RepID=A0A1X0QE63_9MICR|nr:hypothetical protein HERIO_220 [Hepatospora eriocheir]
MFKTNIYKITLVFNKIILEFNYKFGVLELSKNIIFNKKIRNFSLESHKSGSGGVKCKFYQDILNNEINWCELVTTNYHDFLNIDYDKNLKAN